MWSLIATGTLKCSRLGTEIVDLDVVGGTTLTQWAMRSYVEGGRLDSDVLNNVLGQEAGISAEPAMNMTVASLMQQVPFAERWRLAEALVRQELARK